MNKRTLPKVILILLLTGSLVPLINLNANQMVKAAGQTEPAIFEAEVPLRGTYLRAFEWWPYDGPGEYKYDDELEMNVGVSTQYHNEAPLIVDLEVAGFAEGDKLIISYKGEIYFAGAWYPSDPGRLVPLAGVNGFSLNGVFSATSALGPTKELKRVSGAIDAGIDYTTEPTWWGQERADIIDHAASKGVDVSGFQYGSAATDIPQDFQISPWWSTEIEVPQNARYLFICVTDSQYFDNLGSVTVTIQKDTDGDGLRDSWETKGIDGDGDGDIDLTLKDANWAQKDIYVEVDYMQGHKPDQAALDDVVAAFRNCPDTVEYGPINLHIEVDTTTVCPHYDYLRFDDVKDFKSQAGFGTYAQQQSADKEAILEAKRHSYHYCLFLHSIEVWNKTSNQWTNTTSSGIADLPGRDFVVSLGAWTGGIGSRDEQAGTFMHELGHNLGLDHGGGDDVNYKPNYLSVMNYQFQTSKTLRNRPLTYSSAKLRTLTESGLDETTGLNAANWDWTVYSGVLNANNVTKYVPLAVSTLGAIDWDNDGDEGDTYTQANINNFPKRDYVTTNDQILYGFDDWTNLNFHSLAGVASAGGLESWDIDDIEMTWEVAQTMEEDAKNMVGGPTGPVQILDVAVPQEQDSSSPIDTSILVIVAAVAIGAIGAAAIFVLRKRKKQPVP